MARRAEMIRVGPSTIVKLTTSSPFEVRPSPAGRRERHAVLADVLIGFQVVPFEPRILHILCIYRCDVYVARRMTRCGILQNLSWQRGRPHVMDSWACPLKDAPLRIGKIADLHVQ